VWEIYPLEIRETSLQHRLNPLGEDIVKIFMCCPKWQNLEEGCFFILQQFLLMGRLTIFVKIPYKTVQYYVIFEVLRSLLMEMAVHTGTMFDSNSS
jgi:hypothetical protein